MSIGRAAGGETHGTGGECNGGRWHVGLLEEIERGKDEIDYVEAMAVLKAASEALNHRESFVFE